MIMSLLSSRKTLRFQSESTRDFSQETNLLLRTLQRMIRNLLLLPNEIEETSVFILTKTFYYILYWFVDKIIKIGKDRRHREADNTDNSDESLNEDIDYILKKYHRQEDDWYRYFPINFSLEMNEVFLYCLWCNYFWFDNFFENFDNKNTYNLYNAWSYKMCLIKKN